MKVALVGVSSVGYHSLALGYLRAYAQSVPSLEGKALFQTLELDVSVDPWWIAYRIAALDPDVVGFSVTCWNAGHVYDACRVLKQARPDAFIVLGGPEVGPIAAEVIEAQPAVDAVVSGEGEITFSEILLALAQGHEVTGVPGVTTRSGGTVVRGEDRPLIEDLDEIPSPYLSGVMQPTNGYSYLETYRGCPCRCAYCFEGKGYGGVRKRSYEKVAEEIEFVATAPGVASFSFIDPVFNLNARHLSRLCEILEPYARRGTRLHTIEVNVEKIGPAEAAALVRAGVESVETGPQTTGKAALRICNRSFDEAKFAAGVRALQSAGIRVECDLIMGLPGDTVDTVLDSLRFVLSLGQWKVQVSTLHVLPGTEFWASAENLGLRFNSEPPHEVIQTSSIAFADLRRLEEMAAAAARAHLAVLS